MNALRNPSVRPLAAGVCGIALVAAASCSESSPAAEPARSTPAGAQGSTPAPAAVPAGDSATLARGKEIYTTLCLTCHGETGRGDGPMARFLTTKPRSLADEPFAYVDPDLTGDALIKALAGVVAEGLPDAGMTAFGDRLSQEEMEAVSRYVLSLRR